MVSTPLPEQICSIEGTQWTGPFSPDQQTRATTALEDGRVVYLPTLDFVFSEDEKQYLTPAWSNGAAKNISYDARTGDIKGMKGDAAAQQGLAKLLQRYADSTLSLMQSLFPAYKEALIRARTSFRPVQIAGRASSLKKDDTRLHPDAFPTRPTAGKRIIRVFANVNPHGQGRDWRIGEPFADFARKMLPRIKPPAPLSREFLYLFRVTRTPRTPYDHYMLGLHDTGKLDEAYQKTATRASFSFPPHCTWICFSDEVLHAVDAGQYLMEQTYMLPHTAMAHPEKSPAKVLEGILGRKLL